MFSIVNEHIFDLLFLRTPWGYAYFRSAKVELLTKPSKAVTVKSVVERAVNPKRLARIAAKEINAHGISTKAQEAIRDQLEGNKQERQITSRQMKEAAQAKKREIAIQKAKQKHRGK